MATPNTLAVLKIRVSMVRFRPRPPELIKEINGLRSTASPVFLSGVNQVSTAPTGSGPWLLAGAEARGGHGVLVVVPPLQAGARSHKDSPQKRCSACHHQSPKRCDFCRPRCMQWVSSVLGFGMNGFDIHAPCHRQACIGDPAQQGFACAQAQVLGQV